MEGLGYLISPSRNIYDAGGLGDKARINHHPRLRTRRKTWAGFLDNRPQSAPSEAFFTRFADIGEDEVLVSMLFVWILKTFFGSSLHHQGNCYWTPNER